MQKSLKIIEWNINLRTQKKFDYYHDSINVEDIVIPQFVNIILNESEADIIVLTEFIKCVNWEDFVYSLVKYNVFVSCDKNAKGILIAVKKDIEITNVIYNIPVKDEEISPHFLQVNVKHMNEKLIIIGTRILVTDGSRADFEFRKSQFTVLTNYLKELEGKSIVVTGDFNNARIISDYKGKDSEPYNYTIIEKGFKDISLSMHTPEDGFSHGGYLKEDHIIVSEKISVTCEYSDSFINEKIMGQDIFYNIYYKGKYNKKQNVKIPIGYPDHEMLIANIDMENKS